jgi:hypothetical protein
MSELANNNEVRAFVYLLAAACCYIAGRREAHSQDRSRLDLFPAYWFVTAGFLALMGFGRLSQLGELLGYFGRAEAREAGWYEARRPFQAAAIALIAGGWFLVTTTAVWRVPERRRRYLPAAVLVFTLVCFAAVRGISLHQVDALLYNHPIAGVRLASLLELGGLTVAGLAALFSPQLAAWLLARGVGVPAANETIERRRPNEVPR